jgi:hypothetical protein
LLILRSARRAKKATLPTLPGRRYKIGTKIHSNQNIASAPTRKYQTSLECGNQNLLQGLTISFQLAKLVLKAKFAVRARLFQTVIID